MEAMKTAGMTTEAAVVQMKAVYHQVSSSLINLQRQVREVENSLSVLLAKAPQRIDRRQIGRSGDPRRDHGRRTFAVAGKPSGCEDCGNVACQCLLYDKQGTCRFLSRFEYYGNSRLDERFGYYCC